MVALANLSNMEIYPDTVGWWHPDYPWHRLAEEACGTSLESGYYSNGDASFYLERIHRELIPHQYTVRLHALGYEEIHKQRCKRFP